MSLLFDTALVGQTFLITGGSSGIGRATAQLIARSGGRVIVSGRDGNRLNETLYSLSGSGHEKSIFEINNADETADWVKQISVRYGLLSGIFHGAGVELIRSARMINQSKLDDIFRSSLFGAFGIARAVSQKNVFTDGGSLIFMSSVAGSHGQIGMTAYSSVKAGIDGLVKSLACELAGRRIRVNSIAAGAVKTAMHDRLTEASDEQACTEYEKCHLLGFGTADDVALAAVFLLSGAARWITGTTMIVDGGYSVR